MGGILARPLDRVHHNDGAAGIMTCIPIRDDYVCLPSRPRTPAWRTAGRRHRWNVLTL